MNFIEAIASGKPIRRLGRSHWSNPPNSHGFCEYTCDALKDQWLDAQTFLQFVTKEDILAEDWEAKADPPLEVTKEQFWDCVKRAKGELYLAEQGCFLRGCEFLFDKLWPR